MTDTLVTANELHKVLTDTRFGVIDIGDDAEHFRDAVKDLRGAGHTILVGPRFLQTDGRTSQTISFGEKQSSKSSIDL